jgi:DNA-binding CsgD family transcriptional regulator
MAEGLSMKQAAAELHLLPRTIVFHKYRIMEENRLRSHFYLVRFAIKLQLVASA